VTGEVGRSGLRLRERVPLPASAIAGRPPKRHPASVTAGGSRRSCASAVDRAHPTLEDGEGIDVVALSRMRGTETCPVGALEACMRRAKSGTARCSCGANGTAGGPARCALAAPKLRRHRMPRIPSACSPSRSYHARTEPSSELRYWRERRRNPESSSTNADDSRHPGDPSGRIWTGRIRHPNLNRQSRLNGACRKKRC
jgi:hypothetical protein